jgi:hypothetical protein
MSSNGSQGLGQFCDKPRSVEYLLTYYIRIRTDLISGKEIFTHSGASAATLTSRPGIPFQTISVCGDSLGFPMDLARSMKYVRAVSPTDASNLLFILPLSKPLTLQGIVVQKKTRATYHRKTPYYTGLVRHPISETSRVPQFGIVWHRTCGARFLPSSLQNCALSLIGDCRHMILKCINLDRQVVECGVHSRNLYRDLCGKSSSGCGGTYQNENQANGSPR